MMGNFTHDFDEVKSLLSLSSNNMTKSDKLSVYSTLLRLQEQSTTDPSLLQWFAESSHILISSIAMDISDDDEKIAVQALKSLGFMTYHQSIVICISADDANMILSSLQKVILATRIKSVCNLGLWCISIQQFSESILNTHTEFLARAVIHALENPPGSLSTTYEAIEAVMKLATQLSKKMREISNLWAPPLYRRLVSANKREKDMAERCLLKIRSVICPPPTALSKVVVEDVKRKLIPAMKGLLEKGMKIQTLQAWGWFIRLIGSYGMKNRHLMNELLKIPEQTFPDIDPQTQIASQVAWEALIDALIILPTQESTTKAAIQPGAHQGQTSEDINGMCKANGLNKSTKLIMTPLIGIISSKCDLSVQLSCLNTWNYLLHKLDTSINCPSLIKAVLEPILEVVFRAGPCSRNICSWNFCLDLIDHYALARRNDEVGDRLSAQSPITGNCSIQHYPIEWLTWNLGQFDFFIKMVQMLISHGTVAHNAALRIFRSAMEGVQTNLKSSNVPFNEVMSCINAIVMCIKKISEGVESRGTDFNDTNEISLEFIEIVTKVLQPSILGSSLYKLILDDKYNKKNPVNELRNAPKMVICSTDDRNMVSPIVYLITLYFHNVVNLTSDSPRQESFLQKLSSYSSLLLALYDPYDILHTLTCSLYKYSAPNCLNLWIVIANSLKDYIDMNKDIVSWKSGLNDTWYLVVCHFLAYPFVIFLSTSHQKLGIGQLLEPLKSVYASVIQGYECLSSKSFCENFFLIFNQFLEDYSKVHPIEKTQGHEFLLLCGDVVRCLLEQILKSSDGCQRSKDVGDCTRSSCTKNSLEFAARFLIVSHADAKTTPQILDATSRVFTTLVCFVESLHFDDDIISFVEITATPLLQWLSHFDKNTICQLQRLWIATLKRLQTSWPPITFNSTILKLQSSLLETTLDHPNSFISDPTIAFWNSTYGKQINLTYPQNLVPILEKLSRNGKISIRKDVMMPPLKYTVKTTLNRCVKRVELVDDYEAKDSGSKRKKLELTEHQKEVRRAQQGKSKDCEGRGPGIRTYTSVDFSQGNEDESQEDSQDVRNAEAILEMLKTDGQLF